MHRHTVPFNWGFLIVIFILAQTSIFGQVTAPVVSVKGGRYTFPFTLNLSTTTTDAVLRYTLDGSVPDSILSPQYTSPLTVDKTTTLRVKAFASGQTSSVIVTHTYLFNVNHTFPIVALSFNPADFFNDTTGIYTNFTNNLEVPLNVEFFEAGGSNEAAFSQLMGAEIQGSASAALPQKSLELKPKKAYGLDNIPYKMFSDLSYTSYKRLVLRNNGQDWGITMFRDDLVSSLFTKTQDLTVSLKKPELYASASRPAVVYYNGVYWGVYSVKERMKTSFVEQHFGLKSSEYDMLENETEKLNGDTLTWDSFYKEINSGINYSDNGEFEKLKAKINVQNFLDYNAFNVYVDNEDWPANNVRRFRPRKADGKWNWISYDFDFSMGLFQVNGGFNTGDATPNSLKRLLDPSVIYFNNAPWSTLLFRKCMENANFRRDYINRTADMMNTILKADRINSRIDEYKSLYELEVPNHTKRWGTPQPSLWIDNMNKVKSFANNRKVNIIKHFNDQFVEVTGSADVTLNVSPSGAGSIQFSTINVSNNGWTGTYFKGVDIPVKAIPAEGYVFSRWEGKPLPSTDSININLDDNLILTAIFIPATGNNPCLTDAQPPIFQNCPLNITQETSNSCNVVNWVAPTATDNCGTPSVSSNFNSGYCFPLGTTTVTYRATDLRNNSSECSFTVTVKTIPIDPCATDNIKPIFQNCPLNITQETSNSCNIVNWVAPTATDNCGTPSVSSNFNSGYCFPVGTTTVTYRATDVKNNSSECSFTVTVKTIPVAVEPCATDNTKPIFQNCPSNISLTTTSNCAFANWAAPTATDNCGNPSISSNFNSGACLPIGTTSVVYSAVDNKNNMATCSFNVVVTSSLPPCTRTKGSVVREVWTGISGNRVNDLTTNSKYQGVPTRKTILTQLSVPYQEMETNYGDRIRGFLYPPTTGNYTFYVYGDDAVSLFLNKTGNSAEGKTVVAFTTTWTNELQINKQASQKSATISLEAGKEYYIEFLHKQSGGGDNEGVLWTLPGTSTPVIIRGQYLAQYENCQTAQADVCGNDNQAPVFQNCPNNIALTTNTTCASASWVIPTATDNCGTPSVSSNFPSGTCFPLGSTTVVYTAKDAKNNSSTCSFNVNVQSQTSNTANDIALGITASSPVYKKYSNLAFTITATNKSSLPMTNVKIEFPYPTGTVNGGGVITTLGTWSSYCTGGVLCYTWTIPLIPANTSATLNLPLYVLNNSAPIIATTKLLSSTPVDNSSDNNVASISVSPQLQPTQNLSVNRQLPTQLVPIVVQSLSPNPTDAGLDLDLESLIKKQVAFYFSNTLGKIVKVEYRDIEKGTNNIHFDVQEFQGGIYFVVPETNIGMNVPTKFVKM
jgi:CotH kinase protein/HYR domain/Fn3 associated/Domain of unknown function DUF11/PA14 domain/Divergent InlB B-repeat domain